MAGMSPAELHPNSAGVDVQLVVDDDEMIGIPMVGPHELAHRASRGVHEALGLYEQKLVAMVARLPHERPALVLPVAHA